MLEIGFGDFGATPPVGGTDWRNPTFFNAAVKALQSDIQKADADSWVNNRCQWKTTNAAQRKLWEAYMKRFGNFYAKEGAPKSAYGGLVADSTVATLKTLRNEFEFSWTTFFLRHCGNLKPATSTPQLSNPNPPPPRPAGTTTVEQVGYLQNIVRALGQTASGTALTDGLWGTKTGQAWQAEAKKRGEDPSITRLTGTTARVASKTLDVLRQAAGTALTTAPPNVVIAPPVIPNIPGPPAPPIATPSNPLPPPIPSPIPLPVPPPIPMPPGPIPVPLPEPEPVPFWKRPLVIGGAALTVVGGVLLLRNRQ